MLRAPGVSALLGVLVVVGPLSGGARAATITVNATPDVVSADGNCTLREAVQAANTDTAVDQCSAGSGADLINIQGVHGLSAAGGPLSITAELTIRGIGTGYSSIWGANNHIRVVVIPAPANVTFEDLRIEGGEAPAGATGGNVNGTNGSAGNAGGPGTAQNGNPGGDGGGILNSASGTLTLNRVILFANRAGSGGAGGFGHGGAGGAGGGGGTGTGGSGGAGGSGGGVYSVGPVIVRDSQVTDNHAGAGGAGQQGTGGTSGAPATTTSVGPVGGNGIGGAGGAGGSGGGIVSETAVTVERSTFSQNSSGDGGAGGPGSGAVGSSGGSSSGSGGSGGSGIGGSGGASGDGGAIAGVSGAVPVTIVDSLFADNSIGNVINDGTGAPGGKGTGGAGGLTHAGVGGFGGGGTGGAGGRAADGLAVRTAGAIEATSSTFTTSSATGGIGGAGVAGKGGDTDMTNASNGGTGGVATGGAGGAGARGALFANTTMSLLNVTFDHNQTGVGGAGGAATGGAGGAAKSSFGTPGSATGGAGGAGGSGGAFSGGQLTAMSVTAADNGPSGTATGGTASVTGGATATQGQAGSAGLATFTGSGGSVTASLFVRNAPTACAGLGGGSLNLELPVTGTTTTCPAASLVGDPGFRPLADNGGPTKTLAPGNALVLDLVATGPNCPAKDQRGVARPQGASCDVGAYERALPTAVTGAPTGVVDSAAQLLGSANPMGPAGTAHFEYGQSTAYGSATPDQPLKAGLTSSDLTAGLTGLAAGTLYHARIVVTTPDGTATGADVTFTTTGAQQTGGTGGGQGTDGGQGTGGDGTDRTAPRFLTASLKPKAFVVRRAGSRRGGTRLRWTLTERATITVAIERVRVGHRVGKRCSTTAKLGLRCRRYTSVGGLTIANAATTGSRLFTGRIGRRRLAPGRYRMTLTAKDGAGNASAPQRLSFQVRRR